ncbi:MAG: hypothetical protein M1813_006170 [Trichoglossum hirsutum]|nr:MAG: hypothetical protein M1813_006170 [Trichoglossum hirsutum]
MNDATNSKDAILEANFIVSTSNSGLSDYKLYRSVILDSGATIHICNDRARFQTFRLAIEEEFLYAEATIVLIEGYSNVTFTAATPNSPMKVGLVDTAYVPAFYTTVASLNKFVNKGVHLDTENDCLQQKGKTFCMLEQYYSQWTLEFNELPSIFATAQTNISPTKDIWH